MEAAGLALTGLATIDLCYKYANIIFELCKSFQNAQSEIHEKILRLRNLWNRTSTQMDFLKRIWGSLNDNLQDLQAQTLQLLVTKLRAIVMELEKLFEIKDGRAVALKKVRYAVTKQFLVKAIEDLALWQTEFDPSWYLMMRITDPRIDEALRLPAGEDVSLPVARKLRNTLNSASTSSISVFLSQAELDLTRMYNIPFSAVRCAPRNVSEKWFVIDSVPCEPNVDTTTSIRNVRELARKLSTSDPTAFGILECRGVVRNDDEDSKRPSSFDFIFRIPDGFSFEARSLRSSLLSSSASQSLTDRFDLAKKLARSVCYVHTLGFVHKNIRPETIIGFSHVKASRDIFVLVGFGHARIDESHTFRKGDSSWEKNLYRHPDRQGLDLEHHYVMQHDIYSLGVCLLEIGLWQSFVIYDDSMGNLSGPPSPSPHLQSGSVSAKFETTRDALKQHLITLARQELPSKMGERYTNIVINCLTCLDADNLDFGDPTEFQDVDGIAVSVRYIEKILVQLNEILV